MRLTSLLRGVLRRTEGDFVSLGDEISLLEACLDIERARFEDRLRVLLDVPAELQGLRIPALLIYSLPQANWSSVWMIPLSGSAAEAGMFWRHFFQLKLKETLLLTCQAICEIRPCKSPAV
jgi:hypothetical protein